LRPIESIIGTGDESIEVTYAGGEVVFPNGYRGTIHTPYWDGLKVGAKYIFFLKNDNNRLDSVGKDQGVLELRDSDDSVHTLGKFAQIVHWNERLERHLSSP
jgi:hypothetical protein